MSGINLGITIAAISLLSIKNTEQGNLETTAQRKMRHKAENKEGGSKSTKRRLKVKLGRKANLEQLKNQ
jgi:hypothetical protein